MIHTWKIPHIVKGTLTFVPPLNAWRLRRGATGGSDSARYCYSVLLRHLRGLESFGFDIRGARIGELGPGDSVGVGLAALLSGAASYIGLDVVPFSLRSDAAAIFEELVALFSRSEPIPDDREFPSVRPKLPSYSFPAHLVDCDCKPERYDRIRQCLRDGVTSLEFAYKAPWTSLDDAPIGTLDLILSQAVLEHVDSLTETYNSMFAWLRAGGLCSHVIDFSAHYLSPFWNGHWSYSPLQWKFVRGKREFLLNREPLSTHLKCAQNAGFEVITLKRDYDESGLKFARRSDSFWLTEDDAKTRGAVLILRKPSILS